MEEEKKQRGRGTGQPAVTGGVNLDRSGAGLGAAGVGANWPIEPSVD